jgi:ribosomal protein L24E
MKIVESGGSWAVVDDDGKILMLCSTNTEAWRWLERHERDPVWVKAKRANRRQIEKHRTIIR